MGETPIEDGGVDEGIVALDVKLHLLPSASKKGILVPRENGRRPERARWTAV